MSLLAHDMRNPLSAVLTNLNFVKSSVPGRVSEVDDALSDSVLSCTMLGQVIANLDILARTLSTATVAPHAVPARRVADEAAVRFAPQAAMNGVRLEVEEISRPPVVLVEPSFFARALDNVIANSLQYSPAKGEVRIECAEVGNRGVLVVLDDGPAIPAELRSLALSPDGQSEAKQRYDARYGRGLGLYCAAAAAQIAGAELFVGERGGRSAFELSAPLAAR
jgi:signal transduction histidine kinase